MSTVNSQSTSPLPSDGAVAAAVADAEGPSPTRITNQPTRTSFLESYDNVFLLLIGFRLLNALTVQTFFQPDEYFQALEPAWQFAFGEGAGAWMTWVGNIPSSFTLPTGCS